MKPNEKWQVVIPKRFREELGLKGGVLLNVSLKEKGVFMVPLERIMTTPDSRKIYMNILTKTAGTWADDSWEGTRSRREGIELEASERRKNSW